MKRLNPKKLTVKILPPTTKEDPIIPRYYTQTHSDETAELFVTIGPTFAVWEIDPIKRDEVLAKWVMCEGKIMLYGYVNVDGMNGFYESKRRFEIFQREMDLALEAIVYADKCFYQKHKHLQDAPIYIHFSSKYPRYNVVEYWGKPKDYM